MLLCWVLNKSLELRQQGWQAGAAKDLGQHDFEGPQHASKVGISCSALRDFADCQPVYGGSYVASSGDIDLQPCPYPGLQDC